jgi:hypothetical protein
MRTGLACYNPTSVSAVCAALGRDGAWPAEQNVTLDWEQVAGVLDARLGKDLGR